MLVEVLINFLRVSFYPSFRHPATLKMNYDWAPTEKKIMIKIQLSFVSL